MSRNPALTARARRYLTDAAHAFDHAPVEVTLSVLMAVSFSYMVSSDAEPFREWLEIAIVIVLTGAVAFIATLLHGLGTWRAGTRWAVTAAGAVSSALYGVFVLDLRLESEGWRAAALVAAGVLLVLAAPAFAGRADATERFRRIAGRLLLRTLAVLLYAAALYAGLALALGAVNTLFELDLDARIFLHTFGWVFFVLVTWVIVGGVPDYVRPAESPGPVAAAVHRISAFLVTPLLAIYYIILYAYSIRIAVTGELPKNLVSPLVIAAGLIAGIALVLFDRRDNDSPSFGSLRIAAPLFIPLCLLGVWALNMRLGQYGWTEFRGLRTVLLVTLGALAVAATVAIVRRRTLRLHLLPLTLAAMSILSVVGPWSVIAGSRRSQQDRLADAMSAAGIDWNTTSVTDTIIANEPFREIGETTRYLTSHFGRDALPPLFAQHAVDSEYHVDVAHAAGLRPARPEFNPRGGFAQLATGALLGDVSAGTLHYVRIDRQTAVTMSDADTTAAGVIATDSAQAMLVRVAVAGMTLIADLAPVSRAILGTPGRSLPPDLARLPLRDEAGRVRGEFFVIEIGMGGERALELHTLAGVVRLANQ